jgi:signal transduction histidine kinase
LEDEGGNLWISTANGLARFNPETHAIKVFDVDDGLQGNEFVPNAALKDIYGRLYFGGVNGFNWFIPSFIADNRIPPPVVVTRFSVDNQPVQADLSGRTPVEVQYWQRVIAFEFVALDFHSPDRNQYAYKLEGFDADWTYAGSRRYQSYTNLPGGNYVFKVKAANGDGYWNEEGISIPIRVVPPFWQAVWFRSLVILVLAGLTLGVYSLRMRNIQSQKQKLELTVTQRTEQLRREIEQRRQAEAVLAQKAAEEAVSAERTRLARDLHDAVTQTLFSASLIAEVLPELWNVDRGEAARSVDELRRLTRGALAEMRTLLLELRPASLTQARLEDLLRQLTEALIGRVRLPVAFTVEGERKLPPEVQVAVYRIAQECLNNAAKYSKASQVNVQLLLSPLGVHLEISDNGIGFDTDAVRSTSMGLRIMRERAESIGAELHVHSEAGRGTTISLTWNERPAFEAEQEQKDQGPIPEEEQTV